MIRNLNGSRKSISKHKEEPSRAANPGRKGNKDMKKQKVMDIKVEGINFTCVLDCSGERKVYRLYRRWFENGRWHQLQLEQYANFISVICYLSDYGFKYNWGFKD